MDSTHLPPGPRSPRAAQTLRWLADGPRYLRDCRARYGDVFTLDLLPYAVAGPGAGTRRTPWVFLANPEHIKQVFRADPATVLTGETNMFLRGVVGERSILVLDEPMHMAERRLLHPPLHGDRVAGYRDLIADVTRTRIRHWPVGRPFAVWPHMRAITLEVIVRAIFGITEAAEVARWQNLLGRLLDGMTSARFLAVHGLHAMVTGGRAGDLAESAPARRLLRPVDDAIFTEIAARRSTPGAGGDILSALMREDRTDQQLRDELITLLIAGHESTSTMLAWAFERLLRHPDQLARLHAQPDEDAAEEYADAVVKETLRMRPVLPIVLRKLATPMTLGEHRLPAGAWLAPCAYLVQRDPAVHADPERFRPERFLGTAPKAHEWTPFGGGVRRCLGANFAQLEMRVVLRTVLDQVELRPAGPAAERTRRRFITYAPSRGGRVVLVGPR